MNKRKIKYRYLIGISNQPTESLLEDPQYYVKYFLEIEEEDWKKYGLALWMAKDKLWKTSLDVALRSTNSIQLYEALNSIYLASKLNNVSLHVFLTADRIDREWFDFLPKTKEGRRLLEDARI